MKMTRAFVGLAAAVIALVPSIASAQPAMARLSGVVVDDRGRPVADARVALACPPAKVREVNSDSSGGFLLDNLPPANCRLMASRAGYVTASHPGDPGVSSAYSLVIRQGEPRDGIKLQLTLGARIAGRVTTPEGEAPPASSLHLLRRESVNGSERLVPTLGKVSDDGVFLSGAVPAGDYLVAASPNFDNGSNLPSQEFALTYFPGALDIEKASVITLRAGTITPEVNFALSRVETRTIKGVAIDAAGQPVSAGAAAISFATGPAFIRGRVPIKSAGQFVIRGVQPGRYRLSVTKTGPSGLGVESATMDVEVGLHDVTDLVLNTKPRK